MTTADALRGLDIDLFEEDFLLTSEKSDDDLRAVLIVADFFKSRYRQNRSARLFETGLAISQFRDQSTRTRFAFASAASLLGLSHVDFDEAKSQIAHGETVRETGQFAPAFERAAQSGKPAIIDIHLDPEAITTTKTLSQMRAEAG